MRIIDVIGKTYIYKRIFKLAFININFKTMHDTKIFDDFEFYPCSYYP